MAKKKEEEVEVVQIVDEQPRFRDAIFGIRSFSDLMNVARNPDYNPHIHLMLLLTITALVGIVGYISGA
ncbi:MAG: hypothetical protein GWN18_04010 [Thermoplasmata archaeon]|nr:hypothetical protein [Thermoplasmata archaeon]NIS11190.1 hypothetical protein [Thermoplasmata archaeon]NIS19128.1 hypothetical protein [Thermoplasmata archaeon]NIT76269.1 hypothetical protein [Thermoplasmata archaeon]NIU48272.1 hypothetical protein [Thermoplasmata archaeon]